MRLRVDKWNKYNILIKSTEIAKHLPETYPFSKSSFFDLTQKYSHVVLKPYNGQKGIGVFFVSVKDSKTFEILSENNILIKEGVSSTYKYIRQNTSGKYLIQQRIPLATVDSRPFDIRVMVQRKRISHRWVVTGKFVKVAADGFMVTNVTDEILAIELALQKSTVSCLFPKERIQEIDTLAIKATKYLHKYYPGIRVIGFDIGMDHKGKLWIIEANFRPTIKPFKNLDETMYKRILLFNN